MIRQFTAIISSAMKHPGPTRSENGIDWRSNEWIELLLKGLDPADLLSVLLEGVFEPLL